MIGMLRNIWADLVEKRLWPVAVLLLAGLVAVPMVLAKQGDEPSGAPVTASAALASASADASGDASAIVTLDTQPAVRRHDGRGRDPFVQPKSNAPKKVEALKSTTTTGSGPGAGSVPLDVVKPTSVAKPKPKAKPKASPASYVADLRFGTASSMKTLRNVARLTPLPSVTQPFFVFLGAKSDGKTLVFLVSSDAKATGDGTCKPYKDNCETIELKAGDTEFFDLTTSSGVKQYQMDIIKLHKAGASSAKAKKASKARASKADRRLLRKVGAGRLPHLMGSYRWVPDRGVLVHVPQWADDGK